MLHFAASRGHFEMVKYFLNNHEYYRKNLNIQNYLGETPLHSATSSFIMGNPYFLIKMNNLAIQIIMNVIGLSQFKTMIQFMNQIIMEMWM